MTHLLPMNIEEAVDDEIRAAIQCCLDDFQFFYPEPASKRGIIKRYNRVIRAFHDRRLETYPDFKLSLCLYLLRKDAS